MSRDTPPRRAVARWRTSGALAIVALVVAGCGQTSSPQVSSKPKPSHARPSLMPLSKSPLRVKGTGFVPGERVHVELVDDASRTVEADDSGSFQVTFPSDRCASVTVEAVGSKGSRASFNLSQALCLEE